MEAFGQALALDANYPIVFNNIGSLHFSLFLRDRKAGITRQAVENFRKAIALDATYASAYNGLGDGLPRRGDMDGAIAAGRRPSRSSPTCLPPLQPRGGLPGPRGEGQGPRLSPPIQEDRL